MPRPLMLLQPGFGEWPPLRIANLTWNWVTTWMNAETSLELVGLKIQCGSRIQVSDLVVSQDYEQC